MRQRKNTLRATAVPPARPRNPVVLAVVRRLGTLAGRRHDPERSRRERLDRMDLDQRVRECGEW